MYSKIAFANSTRVFHRLRFNSSDLHRGRERLHHRVVQAVPDRAERWLEPGGADPFPEDSGGELGAVIGVNYPAWLGAPVAEGHV